MSETVMIDVNHEVFRAAYEVAAYVDEDGQVPPEDWPNFTLALKALRLFVEMRKSAIHEALLAARVRTAEGGPDFGAARDEREAKLEGLLGRKPTYEELNATMGADDERLLRFAEDSQTERRTRHGNGA